MPKKSLTLSVSDARRLAVASQLLAGETLAPPTGDIMTLMRALGCVQIDPIRAVERTERLVLWSRLGSFDLDELRRLRFEEFALFEYWAHAASIVLTEDYPIHATWMRHAAASTKYSAWIEANAVLRDHILTQLHKDGPLGIDAFDDLAVEPWPSSGWNSNRNVSMMLTFLWDQGLLTTGGRRGQRRFWHLAEACLPEWTPRNELDMAETVRRAAQRSLRALGVATEKQINLHFTRRRYPDLTKILEELVEEGKIEPVALTGEGAAWPGPWYIHADNLPLLAALRHGAWAPRTVLLSPFDNLICDRARTELLFDFHYRIEIYVPKARRRYGYYVLPILHGERLIGRVDARMDRKTERLVVNNVYAEEDAPKGSGVGKEIAGVLEELASFLNARNIDYLASSPKGWRLGRKTDRA